MLYSKWKTLIFSVPLFLLFNLGDGQIKNCPIDVYNDAPWCPSTNTYIVNNDNEICRVTLKSTNNNCTRKLVDQSQTLSGEESIKSKSKSQCVFDTGPIVIKEVPNPTPSCFSYRVPVCQNGIYQLNIYTSGGADATKRKVCYDFRLSNDDEFIARSMYFHMMGSKTCPRTEVLIKYGVAKNLTELQNRKGRNVSIMNGEFPLNLCYVHCMKGKNGTLITASPTVFIDKVSGSEAKPCRIREPTSEPPTRTTASLTTTTTTSATISLSTAELLSTTTRVSTTTRISTTTLEPTTELSTSLELTTELPSTIAATPTTDCKHYTGSNPSVCWSHGCQYFSYFLNERKRCDTGTMSCEANSYKTLVCSHKFCDHLEPENCKPNSPMFGKTLTCRRKNTYYVYHPKQYIFSEKDSGSCKATVIHAVNLNGPAIRDQGGITYMAEKDSMYRDPHNTRRPLDGCKSINGISHKDTANLYGTMIIGGGNQLESELGKCISYPIPICQIGEYMLTLKLAETNYTSKNSRCTEVRINDVPVMIHLDIAKLSGLKKSEAVDAVVMFLVKGGNDNNRMSERALYLKGHVEPILVKGGEMNLQFCYGYDCVDNNYLVSAFSLERLSQRTKQCKFVKPKG